jgi:hypothetical protein
MFGGDAILILSGAALLIASASILIRASSRKAGTRAWIRGILTALAGVMVILTASDAALPWPRSFVIFYPADMERATQPLKQALELLGSAERVAFVQLRSTNDPPAKTISRPAWSRVGDLIGNPNLDEHINRNSASIAVDSLLWPQQIDQMAEHVLSTRPFEVGRKPRDSVLVLSSPGTFWAGLSVSGAAVSNALSRVSVSGPREYFSFRSDAPPPGKITADVSRGVLVAGMDVRDVYDTPLIIRMESVPKPRDGKYAVTVQINNDEQNLEFDESAVIRYSATNLALLTTNLSACFRDKATILHSGFNRIALHLRINATSIEEGGSRTLAYRSVSYIEAVSRVHLVLHPPEGLGELGEEGYSLTAKIPNVASRLNTFYGDRDNPRMLLRSGGSQLQKAAYPPAGDNGWRDVAAKVVAASTLALVEPSLETISSLEASLNSQRKSMENLIRDGLHVLVIGPPARRAGPPFPTWLATAATNAPSGDRALKVHRDPRIYFLFDNSRPMWFLSSKGNTSSILEQQSSLVSEIFSTFGKTNPLVQLDGEPTVLFPPLGRTPEDPTQLSATVPGLYSPLLLHADFRSAAVRSREALQRAEADLWPGSVRARISGLTEKSAEEQLGSCFRRLVTGDRYPNTSVVLFVSDFPQIDPRAGEVRIGKSFSESTPLPSSSPLLSSIAALEQAGVRVYVVRLVTGKMADAYSDVTGQRKNANSEGGITNIGGVSLGLDCSPGFDPATAENIARRLGKAIALDIKSQKPPELRVAWGGRVIDDRTKNVRPAPHLALELESITPAFPPNAVITNPRAAVLAGDSSAVVSRVLGDGSVTVLSFSPFALDMWNPDVGDSGDTVDGWGIQRFIDLTELTASGGSLPNFPILGGVQEFGDGSGVRLDFWSRFSSESEASALKIDGLGDCSLVATLRPEHRIVTHYRARTNVDGRFYTVVSGEGEQSARRKDVYLNLRPAPPTGETAWDSLAFLSSLSGGAVVDANTASDNANLRYRYPCTRLAVIALLAICSLLFSPVAQPWTAIRIWINRLGQKTALESGSGNNNMTLQGTSVEFGLSVGTPEAIRQAGFPGGQRPFESGDALGAAKPASLVGFTEVGERIGLPPSLPLMCLRHASQSTEAIIVLDVSPSMFVPETSRHATKVRYASALTRLLAAVLWQKGAYVRLANTAGAVMDALSPGSDASDVDQVVTKLFTPKFGQDRSNFNDGSTMRNGVIPISDEFAPGATVFFISDLSRFEPGDLSREASRLSDAELKFRALHLIDSEEFHLTGLGRTGFFIQDRNDWTQEDVSAAYKAKAKTLRTVVERAGGLYVLLFTSETLVRSLERIAEEELLD